jgi:hypothetical protein
MVANSPITNVSHSEDEKVSSVMAYTLNGIFWGEVITKSAIRVSTWLRTNSAPDYITLYNARALNTNLSGNPNPALFHDLHIPTPQIIAFHLLPPAKDPLDYDPEEPNRKMELVTILQGNFRIDGKLRLSQQTVLGKYLEVTREQFTPMYEADLRCLTMTALGAMHVPYVLVRQNSSIYASNG